jgi:hypothetical protein
MNKSDSARFPVTVTRLPVTRCKICARTLAYRPGQASAVLTQHYHRMHPEALAEAADGVSSPDRGEGTLRLPALRRHPRPSAAKLRM